MDSNPPLGSTAGKSSTGLDANVAALITYVLTWVTGLVFFLIEKESRYVRFHAMQAILLGAAMFIITIVLNIVGFVMVRISLVLGLFMTLVWLVVGLAFLAVWIYSMIKAYQGQEFRLPVIGDMAANIVN